jgi:hypothetical protein
MFILGSALGSEDVGYNSRALKCDDSCLTPSAGNRHDPRKKSAGDERQTRRTREAS